MSASVSHWVVRVLSVCAVCSPKGAWCCGVSITGYGLLGGGGG